MKYAVIHSNKKYRIIDLGNGIFRLQYRAKRTLVQIIRKRPKWVTIPINFDNLPRLKYKVYHYELEKIFHPKREKKKTRKRKNDKH